MIQTNDMKSIEYWLEPTKELRLDPDFTCQMSIEDHGFLSGLIRELRPRKVLEVGTAYGGTTSLIVKSLELLEQPCEMISVDIKEIYRGKETGCVFKRQPEPQYVKHSFMLGRELPYIIDDIGGGWDLVILDTMHKVPGEILDFLAVMPHLSDNGTVVLHDIMLSNRRIFLRGMTGIALQETATKILFASASGEKYYNFKCDDSRDLISKYSIAAIKVNGDTFRNAADIFFSLSHIWSYKLPAELIAAYRGLYARHYGDRCIEMFDMCLKNEARYRARVVNFRRLYNAECFLESSLLFYDKVRGKLRSLFHK